MSSVATEALRYAAFTDGGRGGNPAGIVGRPNRLLVEVPADSDRVLVTGAAHA
jgi:hypothetical protein